MYAIVTIETPLTWIYLLEEPTLTAVTKLGVRV
jgi:hypothetical protein